MCARPFIEVLEKVWQLSHKQNFSGRIRTHHCLPHWRGWNDGVTYVRICFFDLMTVYLVIYEYYRINMCYYNSVLCCCFRHWCSQKQLFTKGETKCLSEYDLRVDWCLGCLSGPRGFTCWISFAPVFSFIYCWDLIFALSPFYILIYMF